MSTVTLLSAYKPERGNMPSILEQYRISDFLDWHKEKRLKLDPEFQRGSVWTPAARTFLIDTILRQLPIPKVYLRTKIDVESKKSVREVVDGQQRLRAILDFAEDEFALSKRAEEFEGMRYSDLTQEKKTVFLSYPIAVDQLVNASTEDVLEVFARLNSYTVSLNEPEKRHAKFQGDFKFTVRAASRSWGTFWKDYNVLSTHDRVRMFDDSLTAEMFGVLLDGVKDGGQKKIDALYKRYDKVFDPGVIPKFDNTLKYIVENFGKSLIGTRLFKPTHLLMLYAAVAYVKEGIPLGDLKQEEVNGLPTTPLTDINKIKDNLLLLSATMENDTEPAEPLASFWKASRSSTQRIASRRVRFPFYVRALGSDSV
jgi:hypothetical protein